MIMIYNIVIPIKELGGKIIIVVISLEELDAKENVRIRIKRWQEDPCHEHYEYGNVRHFLKFALKQVVMTFKLLQCNM